MKRTLIALFLIPIAFNTLHAQGEITALSPGLNAYHLLFDANMKEGVACYRIPALVTAPNGDLIAAIDERVPSCGDLKWSRNINILMRRSTDHGDNWSEAETIVDFPDGKSASDPSMIVDELTGEIFLFYNFMDHDDQKGIYDHHVIRSKDNGKSWSEAMDITEQICKPEWHGDFKFITSGRGIQTYDGRLLHCLVNLDHGMHVFGSDDHGKSWYVIDTPIVPGDESKIVELYDGSLMVNSRLNNPGYRQIHTSEDRGNTWQSIADTNLKDPGCNASIIRYTSKSQGADRNRLLFSNARDNGERKNMTVSISYDEGKTWKYSKTIYPGPAAYSSLTILENGDIGLFFEKDDYRENVFVSFSLEWLTDGMDSLTHNQ